MALPTEGPIPDLWLDLFLDMSVPPHELYDLKTPSAHFTKRWKSGRRTQSTHTHTPGPIPGLIPGPILELFLDLVQDLFLELPAAIPGAIF